MDSFFGIGIFELVMIAIVALVVLGPERLPAAMREMAKWIRQLRDISSEFQSQFGEELKMLDEINPRRIINEAIDPKTQPKPTPVQPPAPKPVAPPPAKPPVLASSAPVNAAFPAAGAAAASKPANASADAGGENTILPPATGAGETSSAAETSEPGAPSEAPAANDSEQEALQ